MATVGEGVSSLTSGFSGFNLGGIIGTISYFILFGLLVALIGGITYWFVIEKKYNKKISIYENIAGQGFSLTRTDKAMSVKMGDGGEEVLKLKKHKLYRPAYGKKIGKNHYAYAIGEDGYWYNFTLGNIDEARREMGMIPVDKDMRMMHVAIRRNIKDRYEQITFLQKYGGLIAYTGLIAMTGIMMWLLFDKFLDIGNTVNTAIQLAGEVNAETARLLGAMDNLNSGGGITAV